MVEMKHEHEAIVDNYVADIDKMLRLFIKNKEDRQWAHDEIVHGGPPHKQVLSALLLSNTFNLIKTTEKRLGRTFAPLAGTPVINSKFEEEYTMPVDIILNKKATDKGNVAKLISKAPDHESLVYLMVIQAMEWVSQQ